MAFSRPLRWPIGWPRTVDPSSPSFEASSGRVINELESVLDHLGCNDPVITTNQETRLDGGLRTASWATPDDTGVALYFERNGKSVCIPCDKFTTVYGNLRAIGLTLEYIKRMERYGTSQMVDAVFTGFAALPATASESNVRSWYDILEVQPTASVDLIKAAYKSLANKYHPDKGGTPQQWQDLQDAYVEGIEARGRA